MVFKIEVSESASLSELLKALREVRRFEEQLWESAVRKILSIQANAKNPYPGRSTGLPALLEAVDSFEGEPDPIDILELAERFNESPRCVEIAFEEKEARLARKASSAPWLPAEDAILLPTLSLDSYPDRETLASWARAINALPENLERGVRRSLEQVRLRRGQLKKKRSRVDKRVAEGSPG